MLGVEAVEGVEGNLNRFGGGTECKRSTKASTFRCITAVW